MYIYWFPDWAAIATFITALIALFLPILINYVFPYIFRPRFHINAKNSGPFHLFLTRDIYYNGDVLYYLNSSTKCNW